MQHRLERNPADSADARAYRYAAEPVYDDGPGFADMFNMATVRGILWRQRYVLAGVVAIAVLAGLVATLLVRPVYEAKASVRVDPEAASFLEAEEYLTPTVRGNEVSRYLATLGTVVESRALAYRVVDSLKLTTKPAFFGKDGIPARPEGMTAQQWQPRLRETAASILQAGVTAETPIDRRVVIIRYRSENPAMAKTIANAYVENFLTDDIHRRVEANAYAQRYLEQEIQQTRIKLQDAELRANSYARAHGIVNQASTGDSKSNGTQTVTIANLTSINATFTEARARRIAAQQRWLAIASTPAAQLQEVQQNGAVQSLLAEQTKLNGQLSDLRQRYGENYPAVRELKAQVTALGRQITQTGNDIKASLRNEFQVALKQEQALSAELDSVSGRTLDEQDRRVQFGILDREAEGLRMQLETLLTRYNEIAAAANVRGSNITKLDAAVHPSAPVSPDLKKNLLLSLVAGIALAIGLAVLREIFDDRLRSADDVERKLGLPLMGLTPHIEGDVVTTDNRQISEAYSSIRTSIDFVLPQRDHNVLIFTSSQTSEGKTTTAAIVASKYAQLGRKVLLVDADLRKPSVASYFGAARNDRGFVEVLLGQASLESVLLDQPQANLDVLPVGPIPPNPVDVLSSPLLGAFLEKYAPRYSIVIFDSPPVMGLADTPLLSRLADGIVFIVESNRAHFGQTKAALRRLRDAHANVLGVVLTKYHSLNAGASYHYSYQYYEYGADKSR